MKNHPEEIYGSNYDQEPIFILGIGQRSGTNFLFDLLLQHPDCWSSPVKIKEDFLIYHSDILVQYTQAVGRQWKQWVEEEGLEDSLFRNLGDGIINFLTSEQGGKRFVTKTPSVRNLDQFFKLFPNAYLIILVRDGRAVVESQVNSFGECYETAIRKWAKAAETILRNDVTLKKSRFKYMIVKYEDLFKDTNGELEQLMKFLKLDSKRYNFDAAINLPVRGSSVYLGEGKEKIHWKPVNKTKDFKPLERWKGWSRLRHEEFSCLAGKYLLEFGYEKKRFYSNNMLWTVLIQIKVFPGKAKQKILRISPKLKEMVKQMFVQIINVTHRLGLRSQAR